MGFKVPKWVILHVVEAQLVFPGMRLAMDYTYIAKKDQ